MRETRTRKRVAAFGIFVAIVATMVATSAQAAGPPSKPLKSGTAHFDDDKSDSTNSGTVIPSDRRTIWNPGLPGGIPKVTTIFATIDATKYGNGMADARTVINNAIAAAGAVATDNNHQVCPSIPARAVGSVAPAVAAGGVVC